MTSNRERSLRAATELIGTQGIRALTHVRVDEHAGLPRGSTSNSFRTRAALLNGVVEHMLAIELPAMAPRLEARTPDELADALADLFDVLVEENRTVTAARLALFVEAGHDPELRAALASGRSAIDGALLPALAGLGAPDPGLATQAIASCFEGLFLHRIGGHAPVDARGVLRIVVRAAFA
jgi:DNA-binding transcriptional regulator YbjK